MGREKIVFFEILSKTTEYGNKNVELIEHSSPIGNYDLSVSHTKGSHRLLSKNGEWYAFQSQEKAYVIALASRSSAVVWSSDKDDDLGSVRNFTFSPDGGFFSSHLNGEPPIVHVYQTAEEFKHVGVLTGAPRPTTCNERFLDGSTSWCGGVLQEETVTWSPFSGSVVFEGDNRELYFTALKLKQVTPMPDNPFRLGPNCSGDCPGSRIYEFQPK